LNYNITLNTLGTYKVECDNVGGTNTRKDITFNVIEASCPTGQIKDSTGYCYTPCPSGQTWDEVSRICKTSNQPTFDITNINSSPNQSGAQNTFTWTSEADTCNVYTNDKATRLNPSASTKSGNNFSAIVPSQNMSNPPGSYLYYIKCYSSTRSPSTNIEADASDPSHTGWKSYTVSLSCPAGQTWDGGSQSCKTDNGGACPQGQVKDSTGYCHAPCPTGQTWDEVSRTCKVDNGGACPQGQVKDSTGYCHAPCQPYQDWYEAGRTCNNICNPAMIYDSSSNTCSCPSGTTWNGSTCATPILTFNIASISSTPNQSGAQNTFTWTSEADTCNVYTNDKATRLNPSASTKSGNNFSAIVPSQNMSNPPGSYLYYIKCYSSTRSPSTNIEADASDPSHTGWKSYTVSLSCPAGQVANAGETCI
jgi:hypothetical protein